MPINVAVVGLGKMGLSHLAIINALADFRVVAICDSAAMVGGVIAKYGKLNYVADYDAALKTPGLQAVVIATPTGAHAPMVRKALDRGLHVFCEKPLTLSAAESEALAALAAAKGLVAQVGYHNRFIGTFAEAKRLVASGALGRVSHVMAEAYGPVVLKPSKPTWRSKAGQGGGCLYDYAAHPLNLATWLFGRPEGVTGAVMKRGFSAEVDDEVYATLGFAGGVTGQLSVNWSDASVRKMSTRLSVWGEGGKLYCDRQELQLFLTGSAPLPDGYGQGWTVRYITELTPPVSFYLRGEEYSAQLEAFGRAILAQDGTIENGFAGSADTDAAIEMIRAAAAAGGSEGAITARAAAAAQGGAGRPAARPVMEDTRTVSRSGFGTWRQSRLLNAWVDALTIPEIIERLDDGGMLFTLNPDHLYHLQRNPAFAAAYADAALVSSDSKYVYWALGLIGRRIPCKTSGSDIVPAYYRHHAANPDVSIFFLGARPGIAQQALERVNRIVGRDIVVGAHGPSFGFVDDAAESAAVVDMVNASGATCLIVGLGAPKQEVWIHRHRHLIPGVKVYMGVGAVIDYEADAVKRAPGWMNRNGLEWLYRMVTEPRRYWRRYARTMEFFWLVAADRLRLYRPPAFPSPATIERDATPRPLAAARPV